MLAEIFSVVGLVVSVVAVPISAYLGYRYGQLQQRHNQAAERSFLLRILMDELKRVQPVMEPYRVEKAFIRDPIQLAALDPLLSKGCLDYVADEALILHLLNLHVTISKYNDRVRVTNLAQSVTAIPDHTHHQMYQDVQNLLGQVAAVRDLTLNHLRNTLNA